ncbi:sensor histidine kinase [Chitinophaga sp. GCM10012297]|uniref:Histidine kinase n=1 Tax=Chitinophaga chungangae TaxID=2821488 RepID=A0ABS3YAP5_9BACT|nr:histidine kinase [Chitinophaga chungangae]MBO9151743.1 histidine kinase [Chitinophaga chungangae]
MSKRNVREALGFNDKWFVLLGIPIVGFLTPIVYLGARFNRPPYYEWIAWAFSTAITAVFWFGNRAILVYMRRKYPLFGQSRKRILISAAVMLMYTLIVANFNGVTPPFWSEEGVFYGPNLNMLGIVNTLAIVSVYEIIYYMRQLRESVKHQEELRAENLLAQIRALKNQVDPHFLFNNLNTLSAIVQDDPQLAEPFIQRLSKLYRYILEMPESTLITVREELDLLEAYVYLLNTRFGDSLKVNINIPASFHAKKMVPFALQLLVENAIKHNIASSSRPLTVNIEAMESGLTVSNNLQKKQQPVISTGKGLENINSRIRLLQQQEMKCITTMDQFIVTLPLFPET